MVIDFNGLHFNAKHWQRPREFLPQRFDPEDSLSLAPDGKKRHAFAWAPFNGGKRVCFGKTFAESNLKIVLTYLTSYYNFEHVDEKYRNKDTYPLAHFGVSGYKEPRIVKLTPQVSF